MTLISKPVRIGQSTYLPVPKDCAELMIIMRTQTCDVDFQIDEGGCRLIYHFTKPVPELMGETSHRPLWMIEKELLA
jgi:hypothetical protein